MTEKTLLLERTSEGIGIITFNRPHLLNALDIATMRQFAEVVEALHYDEDLRVIILSGAGERSFCSGADLVELADRTSEEEAREMITIMGDALLRLERLPVPVIAAINGYALGGGSEIALACDMRILDEKARLGLIQIRVGVTPGWGAGQRLLRVLGYARAMEFLLRGHIMHAREAQAYGLANQVVAQGRALWYAKNFARRIAQEPPRVVRGIKALLQAGLTEPYEKALQTERDIFPPLWADEPHTKAVEAFLERQAIREED